MSEAAVLTGRPRGTTPRIRPSSLSQAAWAYWLVIAAAGGGAVLAALPGLAGSDGWQRFALLATAASVAQLSAVQLTRNRVFHPAIVFVLAGALLLTPQQLVLMCVVQHVPDWLKHRYAWYIQPFNIANYVLAGGAAAVTVHLVRSGGSTLGGREALAGVLAAAVFVGANRILLAGMLRLGRQLSLRASGLFEIDDLALEIVLAGIAVPFAALWTHSAVLAASALAPLVLINVTQRASHRLELASETIHEQNERLVETSQQVIERSTAALEALSATVDARDTYTAGHSRRVRELAVAIGSQLDLAPAALETLGQAALLHDIGKIAVPDAVLFKDGPLDRGEWLLMRAHPQEGANIIEKLGYLEEVAPAIRHHHERPDGQGYPDGLTGEATPLAARIIHVADALDAMLSRRLYREARSLQEALAELRRGSGTDFCSRSVEALEAALLSGSVAGYGRGRLDGAEAVLGAGSL